MSLHQIIYTSCMRGINGINDGQQIFSYDAEFRDSDNDDIKSLFSYQPPMLKPGIIMTEKIAATMPHAFIFRKIGNNTCTLTLNTYLGRDYMGNAGRFGNHLSHVIVSDETEFTCYPCEFYQSSLLRNHMRSEEVNNPNPPDYLPIPVLEKGYTIDVDTVLEFLSIGERLEVYKNMLYAMLAFERERKRVVICDEPQNIIMWIAALEYAVPLKIALGINFTTYEFDPSLSASQICGVVREGTRYTDESKRLHFVFDIFQNDYVEFEKDENFYDFIDTAFSLSFDSMYDFHAFLINGYCYKKADEELYSAYALYALLSDGITGITKNKLENALSFAQKYATVKEKNRIVQNILSQYSELLSAEKYIFLDIVNYILPIQKTICLKNIIFDKIFKEFSNTEISEMDFLSFYTAIDNICRKNGFGLATELMHDNNRLKLFDVIQADTHTWKITFIIKVISTYIKENNIPIREMTLDKTLGQTYYGIINTVYSWNINNGFLLVKYILNEFTYDCSYLVNMSLNIEKMLLSLPNGKEEIIKLWKYFGQKMETKQLDDFDVAYNILNRFHKYEQMFILFGLELSKTSCALESKNVFDRQFNKFLSNNRNYAFMYEQDILSLYFCKLNGFVKENTYKIKQELFNLLVYKQINTDFSNQLITDLINNIPLSSPSKQNLELIQNMFQYTYKIKKQPITEKLFLLLIGITFESINSPKQVKEKIIQLKNLSCGEHANLIELSKKSIDNYFSWILPLACKCCQETDELTMFYNIFDMPSDVRQQFFLNCTKIYLKQCKNEKDYGIFTEYFRFVCEHSNESIRKEIGKTLCIVNKNKIAELDKIIQNAYGTNKQFMKYWKTIKDIAETTNPLLNNISNLFKRKRKES